MAQTSASQELALYRLARRLIGNARIQDFSGGLNLIAAPSELDQNETPDCQNVTLDERGAIVKRLGLSKIADHSSGTAPQLLYYSPALDKLFMQLGADLYKSDNGGSTWSASLKTFSTSARAGICDFLGKVVVIHPVDGAFTYDGATFSGKVTNSPNGNTIAPWQNALFSAGDGSNTITRSDLGAITWPASPVTNAIRLKDDTPLRALITAPGGLLAFKDESTYRVTNPTDISYLPLSTTHGACGPRAVSLSQGIVAALSRRGIIITDGNRPPKLVTDKIEPLFRPERLLFSNATDWVAGSYRDRFVFSVTTAGGSVNDTTLEYHPTVGWFVLHNFGMRDYASYTPNTRRLLGAKLAASNKAAAFDVFVGGTDDSAAVTARFQTPWFEFSGGFQFRLDHIRARGRGSFQIERRVDYDTAGASVTFVPSSTGMLWGSGTWGSGLWGQALYETYNDFWPWQIARSISFVFNETSSIATTGPTILGSSSSVGAFACYGLELSYSQVELP